MADIDHSERMRTLKCHNMHLFGKDHCTASGFPILQMSSFVPDALIGFNSMKTYRGDTSNKMVHFFIDDYQFERVWNTPERYLRMFSQYGCIATPDFSLYSDMPYPVQAYNCYRSRLIGAWLTSQGIEVVPTLQWSDKGSFGFCFDGMPKHSVLAVSAQGCNRSEKAREMWKMGMDESLKRLTPKTLVVFGEIPDYDFPCEVARFGNEVIERERRHGRAR